jgi:hypothetical protein
MLQLLTFGSQGSNIWPAEVPELRPAVEKYM